VDRPFDTHPLLVETIMIGHTGDGYMSFTSRGVELGVESIEPTVEGE
jgi:hypothetical protein